MFRGFTKSISKRSENVSYGLSVVYFYTSPPKKPMVGEGRRNSTTKKSHHFKQLHKHDKGVAEPLGHF